MLRVFEGRRQLVGNRLEKFKQSGAIRANHTLNWRDFGCYKASFNAQGFLCKLRHVSGDEVVIATSGITDKFSMADNCYDFGAAFFLKPQPPTKCHLFFKEAQSGPYRNGPQMTSGSKAWSSLVQQCEDEFHAAQAAARIASVGISQTESRSAVQQFEKKRRADKAEKARESAAKVLHEKRMRRTFSLTEEATPQGAAAP